MALDNFWRSLSNLTIKVPGTPAVQLHDILTRFLNASGGINSVVNGTGAPVTAAQPGPSDVVSYP